MKPAEPAQPDRWLGDPAQLWHAMILTKYRSPFEPFMDWLWCLDETCPDGASRVVPEGSVRNWLACRAEFLDRAWRQRYTSRRRYPADRWLRPPPARHQRAREPQDGDWP